MSTNRVTLDDITDRIVSEQYTVWPGTTTTFCRLGLENGFDVYGKSACVDPANFDQQRGQALAYDDAIRQIWPFEGYLLAERMFVLTSLKNSAVNLTLEELLA